MAHENVGRKGKPHFCNKHFCCFNLFMEASFLTDWVYFDIGHRTVFFGEYQCLGPGANYTYRASYAKQLTQSEAAPYMDLSYINGSEWLLYHQKILFSPDLDTDKEYIDTY